MAGNEWRGGLILLSAWHPALDNAFASLATNQAKRLCSANSLGQQGFSSAEAQAGLKPPCCCLLPAAGLPPPIPSQPLGCQLSQEIQNAFPCRSLNTHNLSQHWDCKGLKTFTPPKSALLNDVRYFS